MVGVSDTEGHEDDEEGQVKWTICIALCIEGGLRCIAADVSEVAIFIPILKDPLQFKLP